MHSNPYQHALDTMQYALNDNGGLAWLKHNQAAILKALTICRDLESMKDRGITTVEIFDDGQRLLVPPIHELQVDPVSPAFEMWHDAEELN